MSVTEPWKTVPIDTWTATVSLPNIGDGRLECRYRRSGGQYFFNLALQFGSTTSSGSGAWSFSLPGAVGGADHGTFGDIAASWTAPATARQASSGSDWSGTAQIVVTQNHQADIAITFGDHTADAVTPFAWAAGDVLIVTGWTEAFDN
jgi:hypothetical protein